MKEKLRNLAPLELLERLKEALLDLGSRVFSAVKGLIGRFTGRSNEDGQDDRWVGKKRLILIGLGGATVLLFGLIITVIVVRVTRPRITGSSNVASGLSIPSEELFSPSEPDFLPGFLPERERRRFWSLDDIRQYWKAPGNSDWWMERIKTTVDSLMEGIP